MAEKTQCPFCGKMNLGPCLCLLKSDFERGEECEKKQRGIDMGLRHSCCGWLKLDGHSPYCSKKNKY